MCFMFMLPYNQEGLSIQRPLMSQKCYRLVENDRKRPYYFRLDTNLVWYLRFWSRLTYFLVSFLLRLFGNLYRRSVEGFVIVILSTSTSARSAQCTFLSPFWATSHKRLVSDRLHDTRDCAEVWT